jgi:SpoVK/Ycf46/Vps4 family AAA+-type ATPase
MCRFVGADLAALATEAASAAIRRIIPQLTSPIVPVPVPARQNSDTTMNGNTNETATSMDVELFSEEQLKGLHVTMQDFEDSIKRVQPSAKREGLPWQP